MQACGVFQILARTHMNYNMHATTVEWHPTHPYTTSCHDIFYMPLT